VAVTPVAPLAMFQALPRGVNLIWPLVPQIHCFSKLCKPHHLMSASLLNKHTFPLIHPGLSPPEIVTSVNQHWCGGEVTSQNTPLHAPPNLIQKLGTEVRRQGWGPGGGGGAHLDSVVVGSCAGQVGQQQVGRPVHVVPVRHQGGVAVGFIVQVQAVEVLSICQVRRVACKSIQGQGMLSMHDQSEKLSSTRTPKEFRFLASI